MGLNELALTIFLGIAVWTDWHDHKIYNKLLAPALAAALILQAQHGWAGIKTSLTGCVIGFGLLLIPYLLGGMGAGDVKLLAVIGAFGGVQFVIRSFLYGAVLGGVVSIVLLVRRKVFFATLKHFLLFLPFLSKAETLEEEMRNARREKFPYGIVLACGTIVAMFLPMGVQL